MTLSAPHDRLFTCVLREKKREQEREELWRKLDELRLQETVQNNKHDVQFTYSNNNSNNNNNNLYKDEKPAEVITDSSEKLTCAE